jgi:hypothetical protein
MRGLRGTAFGLAHVILILAACALGTPSLLPTTVGLKTPSFDHALRG